LAEFNTDNPRMDSIGTQWTCSTKRIDGCQTYCTPVDPNVKTKGSPLSDPQVQKMDWKFKLSVC